MAASRSALVEEVVKDGKGKNGFLFDFFSPGEIVARVAQAVGRRGGLNKIRRAARQTIKQHFDLKSVCLPKQVALLEGLDRRLGSSRKAARPA